MQFNLKEVMPNERDEIDDYNAATATRMLFTYTRTVHEILEAGHMFAYENEKSFDDIAYCNERARKCWLRLKELSKK